MNGTNSIQTGAGRYYQYAGAIERLGREILEYSTQALVLYADPVVAEKFAPKIDAVLNSAWVEQRKEIVEAPSRAETFEAVVAMANSMDAPVIVGVGGGRILDIAKAAASRSGNKVITIPTSAATCAAYALLYVEYGKEGNIAASHFLSHEASCVIADLNFLVKECPARYFISGMVDAMAKYPEYQFTTMCLGEEGISAPVRCAMVVADYTYRFYLEHGAQAVEQFRRGEITPLVEDMVNLNIMMTGILSDLSVGGKSLALAHNYYDGICRLHPEIRKQYLHGELVAMALPMQLAVNGAPEEEIRALQEFLRILSVPTTLQEIGFPAGEQAFDELCDYVYDVTKFESAPLREKIRAGMEWMR